MKILTTLILVSFAVPAFASNVISNDQSTARICALASVQLQTESGSFYRSQVGTSEEGTTNFIVRGTDDCSEKFVDLVSSEFLGADGEVANSDQEILESLGLFQADAQGICDTLNSSDQGQSKIQIENKSTTSGFYFGTGERAHLNFEARCFLQK
ncbi:hypothetical protein D3C87_1318600 [compost metagenome]